MSIHASNNPSECSSTSVDGTPFSQYIDEQIESQTSQNYTQKGGYNGTTQDVVNMVSSATNGVLQFGTQADAIAYYTANTPDDYTRFDVREDGDNNGEYYFKSGEVDDITFIKDFVTVQKIDLGTNNLFRIDEVIENQLINNSGAVQSSAGWATSGIIDISNDTSETQLTFSGLEITYASAARFLDASQNFLSYVSPILSPQSTISIPVTAKYIQFNVKRPMDTGISYDNLMLNFGAVALPHETPYTVVESVSNDGIAASTLKVGDNYYKSEDVGILSKKIVDIDSNNLINPDSLEVGYINSSGVIVTHGSYMTAIDIDVRNESFINIKMNLINIKYYRFRDENDTVIDAQSLFNQPNPTNANIVIPANAKYIDVTIKNADETLQESLDTSIINFGTEALTYDAYSQTELIEETNNTKSVADGLIYNEKLVKYSDIDNQIKTTSNSLNEAVALIVGVERYAVRIHLNDTYDALHKLRVGLNNNLRIDAVYLIPKTEPIEASNLIWEENVIHSTDDEIAPIFLDIHSAYGGNHGALPMNYASTSHGKTNDDLGSVWAGATYEYYLLEIIDDDNLLFISKAFAYNGNTTILAGISGNDADTLTHVSGATNTSTITGTGTVGSQLRPVTRENNVTITVDNKIVTESGVYYGSEISFVDEHEVVDPRAFDLSNIQVDGFDSTKGETLEKNYIKYQYDASNTLNVSYTKEPINSINSSYFAFMQSNKFTIGADGTSVNMAYMPNAAVKSGYDLKNKVDLTNPLGTQLTYLSADRVDLTKSINRFVQVLEDGSGNQKYGYAQMYNFEAYQTKEDTRKNLSEQWEIRSSSGKSYPRGLVDMDGNQIYTGAISRNYFDASKNGNDVVVYWSKQIDGWYLYIDFFGAVNDKVIKLPIYLHNKSIEVIEALNGALVSGNYTTSTVQINATDLGSLVMKLK